ncbi:hypothetical protein WP8S17C03_02650 [Metapseudomonas otitidis]|uniref:Uncharacterized protein n=1 Tax=Metapseudomonas otitidis TaxID=319939 RepID=A0A679G6U1_9GAMM|nr:hypothetical protein [Pseudomonas otitidis]BBT14216.1 hypothetical protein WP8S17C03_02650 [Pseudomonas otitidis]BCA26286.1 hypothetical protein PtoMrB4_02630 [Pseudomonas otitidis]
MGNPIPTLKVILILTIAVDMFWFGDRLLSIFGFSFYEILPEKLISLIAMMSNALMILFNVLLIGLLSRLQLKDEN